MHSDSQTGLMVDDCQSSSDIGPRDSEYQVGRWQRLLRQMQRRVA